MGKIMIKKYQIYSSHKKCVEKLKKSAEIILSDLSRGFFNFVQNKKYG